ncbi:glutathione synthetase, chloroplastic-like [Wolffia australiana]
MAGASASPQSLSSLSPEEAEERKKDGDLLRQITSDALVWSALHGLIMGDGNVQRSGTLPGLGMVHAPFALLPVSFPKDLWKQACELAPLFNDLVDCVSLDGKFLQESLSRASEVDSFTRRLVEIHAKMLEMKKKEDIRLGLHRSDYMLDAGTNQLFQIELNTISAACPALGYLVSKLHRNLLDQYGEHLGLDTKKHPENTSLSRYTEALAKAWIVWNDSSSIVLIIVKPEDRNMYDLYWLSFTLRELYPFSRSNTHGVTSIHKTLSEVACEGELNPDGTFLIGGRTVSLIYFRAGFSPSHYPSESEWRARLMMEKSSAIKCPSISYHLVGTKKIQQELAKPNVLERFLDNKEDIEKLRNCFAGLWSLDDSEILKQAIEKPELFVLKPQREGGGNNIYGQDVRETLFKLQKEGNKGLDAFILMQRIFPASTLTHLVRDGVCRQDYAISELGIYSAYLRNKDRIIINEQSGYLMRTKVSSSNEGGVVSGYAALDSIYLSPD